MATDVERLTVLIEANTRSYTNAMAKLQRDTQRATRGAEQSVATLSRRLTGLMSTAGRVAGVFGVAIGGPALVRRIGSATSAVAQLGDAAEAAGISAEALQVYRTILDQNGASAADADDALRQFNQRLGDASAGVGAADGAFRALDVSLYDANGALRSTGSVLEEVWGKLGRVEDASQLAAIAADLFGTSVGSQMAQALRQGARGLQDTEDRLRRLGILLSDEMVQHAKDLDDQFDFLGQTIQTRFQEAVVTALGGIADGADGSAAAFERLADAVGDVFDKIAGLVEIVGSFPDWFWRVAFDPNPVNWFSGSVDDAISAADRFDQRFNAGVTATTPLEVTVTGGQTTPAAFTPDMSQLGGGSDATSNIADVIDSLRFEGEQLRRTNEEQELYNELKSAGVELDSEAGQQIAALVAANQAQEAQIEATQDAIARQQEAWEQMGDAVADVLDRIIVQGDSVKDVLADLAKQMASQALQSGLQSLFSSIGGTASGGGVGSFLSSLFGGGRAEGGSVQAGRFYSVGERGPELFAPRMSGTIIPAGNTQAISVSPVYNIDASGADVNAIKRLEEALVATNKSIEQRAVAALQRAQFERG